MAKKKTWGIVGAVVLAAILLLAGWVFVGSDIVDSITGKKKEGGGDGGNQTEPDLNKLPTAILEADNDFIREGEIVNFDANESFDIDKNESLSGNGIFFYEWNFKDGSDIELLQNSTNSHIFSRQGIFNVTVKVYDEDGGSDTAMVAITVVPQDTPINAVEILIGQPLIPGVGVVPNSTEVNWTLKENAKKMNISIGISGYNFQDRRDTTVDVVLYNPYEKILRNRTVEVTGQRVIEWDLEEDEIQVPDEYYLYIQCFEGAAYITVQGLVSYVE
ncbi:MAG: PKD domain-containing protein [Thermoplasmatota archaeon]